MLGKVWKKILLLILILACLFDITLKLVKRNSLKEELESTVKYFTNKNSTYEAYSNETSNVANNQVSKTENSIQFDLEQTQNNEQ